MPDSFAVDAYDLGGSTKGVLVKGGQERTIDVYVYADARAEEALRIDVVDMLPTQGFTYRLSVASALGGDSVRLTIVAPRAKGVCGIFEVRTSLGSVKTSWPGMVMSV